MKIATFIGQVVNCVVFNIDVQTLLVRRVVSFLIKTTAVSVLGKRTTVSFFTHQFHYFPSFNRFNRKFQMRQFRQVDNFASSQVPHSSVTPFASFAKMLVSIICQFPCVLYIVDVFQIVNWFVTQMNFQIFGSLIPLYFSDFIQIFGPHCPNAVQCAN